MTREQTATDLLDVAGETFAAEAGITLEDKPAPLYRLLVLSVLLSSRVQAKLGTRACRELVESDLGTPDKMGAATHQQVHDALDRAKFLSKDQTADALIEGAQLVTDRWKGDLRGMRSEADGDAGRLADLLTEVPRLGPVGASIFTREVQAVWPEFRPYLDGKATEGATAVGLPQDADELAALVPADDLARFAAALVRAGLSDDVAEQVGT
ncbi:endonuclease [Actinomycetospora termitidis]|uniref:Endonuclease n=1 Tax=Actinomycetospora termitidis TaxID=3053470 RepID=A0ABT7M217_9PSEU|nr:endonuclease [Actinomycetospora sp. Odt1-22]MDL5154703.1 endonuclease [Actinomycetospora sp. Odt1-22]